MTTSSPASMGGPLSEAERIAEIRARLDAAPMPPWVTEPDEHGIRVGTQFHWVGQCPDCGTTAEFEPDEAELIANAPSDIEFLLKLVGVLEGQLAAARQLSDTWLRNAENVRNSADRLPGLSKVEKAELKQGAIELEHCAHQLRNTLGLDGGGSGE